MITPITESAIPSSPTDRRSRVGAPEDLRREDARVGGRAGRLRLIGALDAALQADDEHQAPDDDRRAQDQDAGLAQRLAEEPQHAARPDVGEHPPAELRDLTRALESAGPAGHRMTWISGW